ncbi:LacI family DNA-binding transcriptional regulator [Microbacterium saperdae]
MTSRARPSQRLIAERANVSQSAVSMVVSGQADAQRIPKATQERILEVMREVGYVPNVAARLLRGQRNGLLGVHTYERVFPVAEDDYYHEFLIGIEEAAVEKSVDLVLFTSTLRTDGKRAVYSDGMNRLRLADGAIFFGLEKDDAELLHLKNDGYPFVFIGKRTVAGGDVPFVSADYAGGIAATLDVLQDAGHSDICYLASTERALPQHERLAAFSAEVKLRGIGENVVEVAPSELDSAADRILASASALMVETNEVAEALEAALAARGVVVPRDVSVVVLDTPAPRSAAAGWSHIGFPRREMGKAAVSLLLERLDDPDARESIVLPIVAPGTATVGRAARPRLVG